MRLGFGYGAAGANNGNMVEQTIWAPDDGSGSAWQVAQAYTYDQVNRIATAAESKGGVQQWSRTYAYDHFGNRWLAGATGHTLHAATPTSSAQIEAATNRLASSTGAAYDAAGNMTAHPFITPGGGMTYDANNKMTAFAATGVSVATKYDAEGRRVRKIHNGQTTVWVYDAFGKLAAEYTTAVSSDTGVYYRTTDHLGSTRLTTNDAGEVVSRRDYFPFGDRIDSTLSGRGGVADGVLASYNESPGMRQQFTGQQRDDETGLDYFWARNYHPALGRFLSADVSGQEWTLDDARSWNNYSYVLNNCLALVDPTGNQSCGSLGVFGEGTTLREAVYSGDRGVLARLIWGESQADPARPSGYLDDKRAIAAVVMNRWKIANGIILAVDASGNLVPQSTFGIGQESSIADIAFQPGQFHAFQRVNLGPGWTPHRLARQERFDQILNADISDPLGHREFYELADPKTGEKYAVNKECFNLVQSFIAANMAVSGTLEDPFAGQGVVAFFNQSESGSSSLYKFGRVADGARHVFRGYRKWEEPVPEKPLPSRPSPTRSRSAGR